MRRLVLALLLAGCSKSSQPQQHKAAPIAAAPPAAATAPAAPAAAPAAPTWYRAALAFEGRSELPFFIALPAEGGEGQLKNGDELTTVDVTWKGDALEVTPRWNWISHISATRAKDGSLKGTWVRDTPLWGKVERPFSATVIKQPIATDRFAGDTPAKVNVTGAWRFDFKEFKLGKGELVQAADGSVTGYIRPGSLGDSRYLEGEVQGDKLMLSTFNGNNANLFVATVSPDGKKLTTGEMSLQNVWNEPFTANRVENWDYANRVHMAKGKSKLSHVPGLAAYAGKPVVLIFFATWCPSCNDATPFMVELRKKYKDRGLEMVSLAYDLSDDQGAIDGELAKFRTKYGVDWETRAIRTTPEKWAKTMPPEIKDWDGFPITAFIQRDGTVHAIYGGWFGPAAGDENKKLKAQFDAWAGEIL